MSFPWSREVVICLRTSVSWDMGSGGLTPCNRWCSFRYCSSFTLWGVLPCHCWQWVCWTAAWWVWGSTPTGTWSCSTWSPFLPTGKADPTAMKLLPLAWASGPQCKGVLTGEGMRLPHYFKVNPIYCITLSIYMSRYRFIFKQNHSTIITHKLKDPVYLTTLNASLAEDPP